MASLDVAQLAERLDGAAHGLRATPQLSLEQQFSVDDAYQIQAASIARRFERGERLVGVKMGLTSQAKARQMGVHEVIWGRLTDGMRIADGKSVSRARYIHPRAEPEVAFLLGQRIDRPMSAAEAWRCVEGVAPAIELIDSRYQNFKFALADVVADNASSSGFVLGAWSRPETDVGNLGVVFSVNGRPLQFGSSAAILGHPARSLAAATVLCSARGLALEPGFVILAGGITEAVALGPGQVVRAQVEGLGDASFSVGE